MSDTPEHLAPTLDNFDAIVAARRAQSEASESDSDADEAPERDESDNDDEDDTDQDDDDETESEDDEGDDEDDEADEDGEGDDDEPAAADADAQVRAPLKAVRAALRAGKVTPELVSALGELEWEIDLPGGKTSVKLSELPGGFMRQARFSREMEKAKDLAAKSENIVQIERARTNAWRQSPAELLQGLRVMGCEQSLDAVFWHLAKERHAYLSMSPEEQRVFDARKQLEQQHQQLRMEQQRIEQMRQQAQRQELDPVTLETEKAITSQMDPALTSAFKSAKVGRVTDYARGLFVQELQYVVEGGEVTPEACRAAAEAVADRFAELRERAAADQRAEAKRKPKELPPRRAPVGPGKTAERDSTGRVERRRPKVPPTAAEFGRRFGV